jgi:TnpA family transposase
LSRRPLLKADRWSALVDMPTDEESLIRHCTLGRAEVDLIQAKRTPHNHLGLAIQLCFLHHLGRAILLGETPPAPMVAFVAQQIGINPGALAEYGRRDTNRREHAVEAQRHLGLHPPVRADRRAGVVTKTESRERRTG